jgi:cell wall-associated NlpC family hydrolase
MSKKTIVIDDHAGTPIDETQAEATRTTITLSRNGQTGQDVTWSGLNLTEESFGELLKLVMEFCPDAEPYNAADAATQRVAQMRADADAAATAQTPTPAAEAAAAPPAAASVPAAKVPAAKSASAPLSQGEARKRSAAVRSWWQSLTPAALKALGLPEAKSGPGRMPPAVTDAYNAAHSS